MDAKKFLTKYKLRIFQTCLQNVCNYTVNIYRYKAIGANHSMLWQDLNKKSKARELKFLKI